MQTNDWWSPCPRSAASSRSTTAKDMYRQQRVVISFVPFICLESASHHITPIQTPAVPKYAKCCAITPIDATNITTYDLVVPFKRRYVMWWILLIVLSISSSLLLWTMLAIGAECDDVATDKPEMNFVMPSPHIFPTAN